MSVHDPQAGVHHTVRTRRRRYALVAVLAGVATAGVGFGVPAAAGAAPAGVTCQPVNQVIYTNNGTTWLSYDSGQVKNTSAASVTRTITHSSSFSKTSKVSGEAGVSIGDGLVGVNAKFGWSAAKTASYTKTSTFSVHVPAHTSVSYKSGVVSHAVGLERHVVYSSCVVKNTYGSMTAVEYEDVVAKI